MKIYYDKTTVKILGTVDGFGDHSKVHLKFENEANIASEDIKLGHKLEQWARDLENPEKPINTQNHRFNGEKFTPISEEELAEIERINEASKIVGQAKIDELKSLIKDENLDAKRRLDAL